MRFGHRAGMLAEHQAQLVERGHFELARVPGVAGRTRAPRLAGPVQLALGAVQAPARTHLSFAPVAVAGRRTPALRLPVAVHRTRAGHAVPVAHADLAVLAHEARLTHARPVAVQHAIVFAKVPQHYRRIQIYRHGDVLRKNDTAIIIELHFRQQRVITITFQIGRGEGESLCLRTVRSLHNVIRYWPTKIRKSFSALKNIIILLITHKRV